MVSGRNLQLVRYRLATTWRGRRAGYLTLVLLLALLGGLAMGSVAAARRTQSSYPVLLASTNPDDIGVISALDNPAVGNGRGYNAPLIAKIKGQPGVLSVASSPGLDMAPLKPDGAPVSNHYLPIAAGNASGSVDGEGFSVDRLAVISGVLPSVSSVHDFVTLPSAAHAFGFHLGEVIPMAIYTNAQTEEPGFGTPTVRPYRRIDMRLVGLAMPAPTLVHDDVDVTTELGYFTPALTRQLLGCCNNYTATSVRVRPGHLHQVLAELKKVVPPGLPIIASTNGPAITKAERAIKPESIAIGVFGGIAGLAALLVVGQTIGRQLRRRAEESDILRALGGEPAAIAWDSMAGFVGALALGALGATVVAVALSPLAPLGPVRPVYPYAGVSFDWTVLGWGTAALLGALGALALLLAFRSLPHRVARRGVRMPTEREPLVSRVVGFFNLRPPAAAGLRFALEPGSGRNTVPVRSAILGTTLALVAVVATVTFGSSLDRLVSTPALYGWNWNYSLYSGGGDIPAHTATTLLDRDPDVAAYTGAFFATLPIDGQPVPVMATGADPPVQPPILSGHRMDGPGQIVLGPLTLAALHKKVGDTVSVGPVAAVGKTQPAVRLRIVGTATMPAVGGGGGGGHLEMGSGALLSASIVPAILKNPFNDPLPGPNAYFIDVKPGVDPAAARRSLEAMVDPLTNTANFGVLLLDVLRPAEIVNYHALGTTPAILGAALGAGALAALALTLFASVRRRRRDLALLKTLGFTRRQTATTVAWQANVAVLVGMVAGIPLGIVAGRILWDAFAREINAVPVPVVPVVPVVLVGIGALVLANAISYLPGRIAARTPTAVLLRTE